MANTNNIMWREVSPLTGDATRLAVSALGNISNGFQALGANVNTGLDRLIDRYDTIDKKNRASNTQLLLNQLHSADSLGKQQILTRQGLRDLGQVRALLGGAEFDEKAYNAALAQWDEGVNNRFMAQDALKMSTQAGQDAYRQAMLGVAQNNPERIDQAIASRNLPLSVLGKLAPSSGDIRQQNLANTRYEDQLTWQRDQLNKAQTYAIESLKIKEGTNYYNAVASLPEIQRAHYMGVINSLKVNGYDDFGQMVTDLKSDNEATRLKAQTAWKAIAPYANRWGLDADALGKLGIKGFSDGVFGGTIGLNFNNDIGNVTGSNTGTNPNTSLNSGSNPTRSMIQNNLNNAPSLHEDGFMKPDIRMQSMSNAQLAALEDTVNAGRNSKDKISLGFKNIENVDRKNPDYIAARSVLQGLSINEREALLARVKKSPREYAELVDKDYSLSNAVNIGGGNTIPKSVLANPTLTPEQEKASNTLAQLVSQGRIDEAKKVFFSLYPNETNWATNLIPSELSWTWRDGAFNRMVEAFKQNGGNPDTFKMGFSTLNHYQNELPKNEDKAGRFTNDLTTNSHVANPSLEALSALSGITVQTMNQYKEEERRHQVNRQLPNEYHSMILDPKYSGDIRATLSKVGTPAQKAMIDRVTKAEEQAKPIQAKYSFVPAIQSAISNAITQSVKQSAARQGVQGMYGASVLPSIETQTITVPKATWNKFKSEADKNPEAKALLKNLEKMKNYIKIEVK